MKPKVVLFDLWMTLVFGLSTDPILTLQAMLNHRQPGEPLDSEFLNKCLTTNVTNPGRFLREVAQPFDLKVPRGAVTAFRRLIADERRAATAYDDTEAVLTHLRGQYRLGLISNLWPFPVRRIFQEMGLGAHFEQLVYSYEVGVRKPNRIIFDHTAQLFGVDAGDCVMVGDSMSSDIEGALAAGMQALLIDRKAKETAKLGDRLHVCPSLTAVKRLLI